MTQIDSWTAVHAQNEFTLKANGDSFSSSASSGFPVPDFGFQLQVTVAYLPDICGLSKRSPEHLKQDKDDRN